MSISISGNDIYDIKRQLGIYGGSKIGVAPAGEADNPKFKVFLEEEIVIVNNAEAAGKLITNHLKKRFPRKNRRGGVKRSTRPNRKPYQTVKRGD